MKGKCYCEQKCDTCKNKTGYTFGHDECGAGNYFEYCKKGHWDGSGPQSEEEYQQSLEPDPWNDCKARK